MATKEKKTGLMCVNCGEDINIENEIHLCSAKKGEWLDKQDSAYMILPNGDVFNLKSKEVLG